MFTRLYVEALLSDPGLADQVWDLWDAGVITDEIAAWAWCKVSEPISIGCARPRSEFV